MELDERYRLVRFGEADEVDEGALIEFWDREGAMDTPEARRRVAEVAFVVTEQREGVVDVSTVLLKYRQQLRMDMWYFRTFVAHEHRRTAIALSLLTQTRDYLEEQFVTGRDTRAPGVILELENEGVKRTQNEAFWWWPGVHFTFIGENAKGDHRRVYYFARARVPLPEGARI